MSVTVASLGSGMRAAKTRQKRRRQLQPHCEKIDRGTKNRHKKKQNEIVFWLRNGSIWGPVPGLKSGPGFGPCSLRLKESGPDFGPGGRTQNWDHILGRRRTKKRTNFENKGRGGHDTVGCKLAAAFPVAFRGPSFRTRDRARK